jgi:hypothetical protein
MSCEGYISEKKLGGLSYDEYVVTCYPVTVVQYPSNARYVVESADIDIELRKPVRLRRVNGDVGNSGGSGASGIVELFDNLGHPTEWWTADFFYVFFKAKRKQRKGEEADPLWIPLTSPALIFDVDPLLVACSSVNEFLRYTKKNPAKVPRLVSFQWRSSSKTYDIEIENPHNDVKNRLWVRELHEHTLKTIPCYWLTITQLRGDETNCFGCAFQPSLEDDDFVPRF